MVETQILSIHDQVKKLWEGCQDEFQLKSSKFRPKSFKNFFTILKGSSIYNLRILTLHPHSSLFIYEWKINAKKIVWFLTSVEHYY